MNNIRLYCISVKPKGKSKKLEKVVIISSEERLTRSAKKRQEESSPVNSKELKKIRIEKEEKKKKSKKRLLVDEDMFIGPSKKHKSKNVPAQRHFYSMKNRCSPESMFAVIQGLSREQKECVRKIGFGSLLKMKMTDVSLKIGFYVLQNFDLDKMKVKVENGYINVNTQSVHDMFGVPMGGFLLADLEYIEEDDERGCMFEWIKQFKKGEVMRLKHIKNAIVRTTVADFNFILNFIVLFINTFCESTAMGRCNVSPLHRIQKDTDVSEIDWCNYIVDCLIRTKIAYTPFKDTCYFFGPTAYLVVSIFFLEIYFLLYSYMNYQCLFIYEYDDKSYMNVFDNIFFMYVFHLMIMCFENVYKIFAVIICG